jgi:hypothetical protein
VDSRTAEEGCFSDDVIAGVGDVQIAGVIYGDSGGAVQLSDGTSDDRERGHSSRGGDFADEVVVGIRDIDIPPVVHGQALGIRKPGRPAIAIDVSSDAGQTGEGGDGSARGDLADGIVSTVGNINVTRVVHSQGERMIEAREGADSVRTAAAFRVAGESGDCAGG